MEDFDAHKRDKHSVPGRANIDDTLMTSFDSTKTSIECRKDDSVVGYVGYLGFGGQIPWAVILVHLPMLEPVVGGKLFSFSVGIAMGIACNLVRLYVLIFGRKFSFSARVVFGSVLSALFTFGYYVIYVCSEEGSDRGVDHYGFWIGLALALLGGAGNAQLLSTGYGIASVVSFEKPLANSLFFLGQAAASALCWPFKRFMLALNPDNAALHLAIVMGVISLISLSLIPVFRYRLGPYTASKPVESKERVTCADASKIMHATLLPNCLLWLSFMCTNLVSPGQILVWKLPASSHTTDLKLYLSLCVYVPLVSDAVGKCCCAVVASQKHFFRKILNSNRTGLVLVGLLLVRVGMIPLFYFPPNQEWSRFLMLSVFGFLQGVVASLSLSLSSSRVSSNESDLTGYLSSFTIANGVLVGSVTGMLIRFIHISQ